MSDDSQRHIFEPCAARGIERCPERCLERRVERTVERTDARPIRRPQRMNTGVRTARSAFVYALALMVATAMLGSAAMAQGEIRRYGTVSLSRVAMIGMQQTAATAGFYELPEAMEAPSEEAYFAHEQVDRCFVSEGGQMQMQQPDPPDAGLPFEDAMPISAGSPVTIRSGDATFLALQRSGDTYSATVSQSLPESATVDIPGTEGGFPAFSGQAFPPVRPVELTAPGDLPSIGSDTTFAWSDPADLGVVMIVAQGTRDGGGDASVVCFAADDGEFSLEGQASLEGVTPQAVVMYGRSTVATYRDGDALLSLSTFTSTLAMQMPGMPSPTPQ